ncbi:amidase [Microbulbifer epialgicus]|uniref:Amidase n=1 Tax=Microbulbifer epialgicus TaxID=393907 RepID=A0ABV4P4C9_9GAMM
MISYSATKLANMIRNKECSCVELTRAYIEQIEKVNPYINAVVQFNPQRALTEAKKKDQQLANGEKLGPLHGLPFTLKDVYATEGDIVTAGCLGLKDHITNYDSTIAKRLKNAGAILLGKTNTPEMENSPDTDNLVYGQTLNPYDLNRGAGGSSGGAAAIVSACGSAFDVGADVGGSVRVPAHYCGLCGVKTTPRVIPSTGVVYPSGLRTGIMGLILTEGPICRFVEDASLLLSVLEGPDGRDSAVIPRPISLASARKAEDLKIAYVFDEVGPPISSETRQAIQDVANALSGRHCTVNHDWPPRLGEGFEFFHKTLGACAYTEFRSGLKSLNVKRISPLMQKILNYFKPYSCDLNQFLAVWHEWDLFRSDILRFFDHYDALICPVTPQEAISADKTMMDPGMVINASYAWGVSTLLLPIVTVRAGTAKSGLPIGVQIITKQFYEGIGLQIATYIEQALGGWIKPPSPCNV